jgi:hypothetical protein
MRYALDAIGKETAAKAVLCLDQSRPAYLVGLTGLPKGDALPKNVIVKGVVRVFFPFYAFSFQAFSETDSIVRNSPSRRITRTPRWDLS